MDEILSLIQNKLLNGCANITGGGLADNIKRIIPDKLCAYIDLSKIKTYFANILFPCSGLVNSLESLGLPDLGFPDDRLEFATRRKGVKLLMKKK